MDFQIKVLGEFKRGFIEVETLKYGYVMVEVEPLVAYLPLNQNDEPMAWQEWQENVKTLGIDYNVAVILEVEGSYGTTYHSEEGLTYFSAEVLETLEELVRNKEEEMYEHL